MQVMDTVLIIDPKCLISESFRMRHLVLIFQHCGGLTKVLLDIKTFEVLSDKLVIVRPPNESWYKMSEPEKK